MSEDLDLSRMIAYCAHLGMLYSDRRLRGAGYDVTPVQSRVLAYLSCCGGAVNQRDLERELHLRPSTINGIVGRLEEKGCISRRASTADARCRLVSLTEAGRARVSAFRTALADTNRRSTACLTEEERRQLAGLLSRVIANLENEVNST